MTKTKVSKWGEVSLYNDKTTTKPKANKAKENTMNDYYDDYDDYEDQPTRKEKLGEIFLRVKPAKAFFVYSHSNAQGETLYLGDGTANAWFSRAGNSVAHDEALLSGEISEMKIVSRHTSKSAARQALRKLIRQLEPRLNEKPKYRPTHRTWDGNYYAAWGDWDTPTNKATVDAKRPSGVYGELFDDLSEFFGTQAGVKRKEKKSFSLKTGTKWGDHLADTRGDKLRKLKSRKWFLDLLFLHGYETISVKGKNGGTTISPK
jgi:hypothetical protein